VEGGTSKSNYIKQNKTEKEENNQSQHKKK